jgi:hypothetical protein
MMHLVTFARPCPYVILDFPLLKLAEIIGHYLTLSAIGPTCPDKRTLARVLLPKLMTNPRGLRSFSGGFRSEGCSRLWSETAGCGLR